MIGHDVIIGRLQFVVANVLLSLLDGCHVNGRLVSVVRSFGVQLVPLAASLVALAAFFLKLFERATQAFARVTGNCRLRACSYVVTASLRFR